MLFRSQGALPGEIREVDVVVRRAGHALARHDVRYAAEGAPGTISLLVHAAPGEVEVETTLVYAASAGHRSIARIALQPDRSATIRLE